VKAVLCVLLACSSVSAAGNALDRLAEAAKQEGPFERLLVSATRYLGRASSPEQERAWLKRFEASLAQAMRDSEFETAQSYVRGRMLDFAAEHGEEFRQPETLPVPVLLEACRWLKLCAVRDLAVPRQIRTGIDAEKIAQHLDGLSVKVQSRVSATGGRDSPN